MSEAKSQTMNLDPFEEFKGTMSILQLIINFGSRPIEYILRTRFGERYFSIFPAVVTAIGVNLWAYSQTTINPLTGESVSPLGVTIFTALFIVLAIYHKLTIVAGETRGNYDVLSRSSGDSWAIWSKIIKYDSFLNRLFPQSIQRIVEPLFVISLGFVLLFFDPALGAFLQFTGFCLYLQEMINYRYARNQYLDTKDARILAKHASNIEANFNQKPSSTNSNTGNVQKVATA